MAASSHSPYTVVEVDAPAPTVQATSDESGFTVDAAYLPLPVPRVFRGPEGRTVHAQVYAPRNPRFAGPLDYRDGHGHRHGDQDQRDQGADSRAVKSATRRRAALMVSSIGKTGQPTAVVRVRNDRIGAREEVGIDVQDGRPERSTTTEQPASASGGP
ncbi:hypothetical protein SSP24_31490 [Streptomyces spinoverrucosus]|uniref:Uncharacterized protein n=1 Tax=Streptomyces spinoverrucosus TaxID=284043 RepID=A0A4Y3VF32_9ACTN|nr:hypothetical protein SSP24_31490 [Streptomyces spinoverrucosus]GHB76822.1 hypothetical protein GCM10010397_53990 [Streptomyces spinoverrucosus]